MASYDVFYVVMTDACYDALNTYGWNHLMPMAYAEATNIPDGGNVDYTDSIHYELWSRVAYVENVYFPEMVWTMMQNLTCNWFDRPEFTCNTDKPRSMNVGDVIFDRAARVWYRCERFGFSILDDARLIEHLEKL